MRFYARLCLIGMPFLLLLAACGGADETAVPTDSGPDQPTLAPAPNWVEADEAITRDNIMQARYLGRLDTPAQQSTVFNYAFSPDSTRLAGLNNAEIIVWDLIGGGVLWRTVRQTEADLYYSADKTELYVIGATGNVRVFNAESGIVLADFAGHSDYSGIVAQYQNRDLLALGGSDGSVKVWDTIARQSLVTFETGFSNIDTLVFSPDGEALAISGSRGVGIWRWVDQAQTASFVVAGQPVTRMAFSPDGTQLAAAGNNRIGLWDIDAGEISDTLEAGDGIASDVLLYSPDGTYLVSGGDIPDMIVWDTESGRPAAQLLGIGGTRTSAVFSPDGDLLVTSVLEGTVSLWDMTSVGDTIAQAGLDVQTDRVLFVDWTADSFLMTFFDSLGPVYVWGIGGSTDGPNG